jgi:hypothetical protein
MKITTNGSTITKGMGGNMSAAVKQMNIWEQKYYDIVELFALNDELLSTVEQAENPEAQLALIEPLAEVLGESAELLTEEYVALCDGAPARKQSAKSRIEGALRKMYVAMHEFEKRVTDTKNVALMVVKKIKRQLEVVVSNFLDFMVLSLDRVMQKHDVEELKQRHANISLMLHQMGHGAS